jgi:hypothetical protein
LCKNRALQKALKLFADCLLRNRDFVRFVHSAEAPALLMQISHVCPDKDE